MTIDATTDKQATQAPAPGPHPDATPATSAATEQRTPAELPEITAVADTLLGGAAKAPRETGSAAPGSEAPADAPIASESVTLPKGMTLDDGAMSEATALFQRARLDQATAQKFVDLAMSREQAAQQRGAQAFNDLQNKWAGEVKADPEIGGVRLESSLAAAARAIDGVAVPGLREALHVTGAGNHPAIVKAFVRLGQMMAEDRFLGAQDTGTPGAPLTLAERLYGEKGPRGSIDGL